MKWPANDRMAMRIACALLVTLGLGLAAPAEARWLKATTQGFVIYSAGSEADLAASALKLEKFDALLRWLNRRVDLPPSESKLSVYWIRGTGDLRQIIPGAPSQIGGFYSATADTIATVAERRGGEADDILFHEYAHHFTRQYFRLAFPSWYEEGFAEYVGTVQFTTDGFEIGRYNEGRARNLDEFPWVAFDEILSRSPFEFTSEVERAMYYAQAWLLTHWILRDEGRRRQLDEYLAAVGSGEKSWPVFQRVFKMNANELARALHAYGARDMTYTKVTFNLPASTDVRIEPLPKSADELLLLTLGAAVGDPSGAAITLERARKGAALYPGDVYAQRALALVEIIFGEPQKALEILGDPARLAGDVEGLFLHGYAKLRLALAHIAEREALLKEARIAFVAAFNLDPNRYQTLFRYVQANYASSAPPPASVLDVLIRAFLLAPQVDEIGLTTASALMRAERFDEAILILEPIAADAHNEQVAAIAKRLLQQARQKKQPNDGKWEFKTYTSYY